MRVRVRVREITETMVFHPGVWRVGHGEAVAGNTLLHLGRLMIVRLLPMFSVLVKLSKERRRRREDRGGSVVYFQEKGADLGREGLDGQGFEARAVTRD